MLIISDLGGARIKAPYRRSVSKLTGEVKPARIYIRAADSKYNTLETHSACVIQV